MQHFKALKETTYGPRLVSPGEVVAMQWEEGQQPDSSIWQAVHSDAHPATVSTGMDSGAPAFTADMPPAMLMDQAKAQHEYQQGRIDEMEQEARELRQRAAEMEGENTRLMGELAALTAERDEVHGALMQKRQDIAALHEERQAMQAEHVELMEKMQEEITALKAENATLKKKK